MLTSADHAVSHVETLRPDLFDVVSDGGSGYFQSDTGMCQVEARRTDTGLPLR